MTKEELQAILNGNKPQQEDKPKRKCRQHEGSLQIACVRWFRLQYPQYAMLLFHPRNEAGQGKSKRIAIDAAAGVVAGVPDLMLALPYIEEYPSGNNILFHGLGIELKYGKTNNQTDAQRRFQRYYMSAGYAYHVVRSLDEFIQLVTAYLQHTPIEARTLVRQAHNLDKELQDEYNKNKLKKITK
jgi:hypothetical protein